MRRATPHTKRWYAETGWIDLIERLRRAGITPQEFEKMMPFIPKVKLRCEDAKQRLMADIAKEFFG